MGVPGNADLLLLKTAAAAGGYQVSRSLRFNSADSAYLSRTPASAGNRKTWTWSGWVKRSKLGVLQQLFGAGQQSSNDGIYTWFRIDATDKLNFRQWTDSVALSSQLTSTAVFRDTSAWYHLVFAYDSTQASDTNKVKIYVNGVQITAFDSSDYPGLNDDAQINTTKLHTIGSANDGGSQLHHFDGYLADIWFLDGIAATPSDFAETDATTGQWIPKAYTGSKGTNGFHLEFADNSAATAAALGKDTSGNGNNWTPNNFQVSSTPTYSNYLTNSYTLTDAASAFDGSTATYAQDWNGVYNANYNYEIVFTPPTPISFTSQVRVFGPGGPQSPYSNRYAINLGSGFGSDVSSVQNGWATVATGSGSITAIRSRSNQNGCFIGAIEIDGVILVQSPGSAVDVLVDTPTSYGTDTGAGGEVRGNYCTMNPLSGGTFTNGNLDQSSSDVNNYGTFAVSSGKWYYEATISTQTGSGVGGQKIGLAKQGAAFELGNDANGWAMTVQNNSSNGNAINNATQTSSYTTFTTNDVVMCAFDVDAGKIWWGKNGTWLNSGAPASGTNAIYTNLTGPVFPAAIARNGSAFTWNFGQRSWAYAAPAGFKALCDTNLPSPVIAKPDQVMGVKLYTGNGSTQTISGLGFSPDLVWLKDRNQGNNHEIFDAVRGSDKVLFPNLTNAEVTDANRLTSFNSNGFGLGANSNANVNGSSNVAWCFDAGTSTVTNTQGSITSQVRTNGYLSIVTYTGNQTQGASVGHGLGVAPSMIIVKNRSSSGPSWAVGHRSLGGWNKVLYLNLTDAAATQPEPFNGTTPTSTVFQLWDSSSTNSNGANYVAYCFAAVTGYSSFGSYTGNGSSDGPFVFCGFRPRWLLVKSVNYADTWVLIDAARETYNVMNTQLRPNSSNAESVAVNDAFDFLSNGFKVRGGGAVVNTSAAPFIYCAFAESPFQYARAR